MKKIQVKKLTIHSSSPSGELSTLTTDIIEVAVPIIPPVMPNTIINIFLLSPSPDELRFVSKSISGGKTSASKDDAQAPIKAIKSPKSGMAIASPQVNRTKTSFKIMVCRVIYPLPK